VVVGELICDCGIELDEVTAERSLPTDWVTTSVRAITAGGVSTVSPVRSCIKAAASTEGRFPVVAAEVRVVLFTAKVSAPAATTPTTEMVVAREVFIGITI
jgi:hypothetical protein